MPEEFCVGGPELDLVRFSEIAGAPIHYARAPVSVYGSIGVPRTPRLDREFLAKLDVCFEELWSVAPAGRGRAIVSGGCYVEKAGMHGAGRAIDIDAIWWPEETREPPVVTLNYPRDRKRYLAVEAVLRKHLGIVLDYHYNKKHWDHFHCDDSQPVGFFPTASRVVFVQAALIHVFGVDVAHDGVWGAETEAAVELITSQLAINSISLTAGWLCFLDAVALTGFGICEEPEAQAAQALTRSEEPPTV